MILITNRTKVFETSPSFKRYGTVTSSLLMMLIVLCGTTYRVVSSLLGMLGIFMESESKFGKKTMPFLSRAVEKITNEFILKCRSTTPNLSDVHIMIDAGWSHPGWWARECTVIALDGKTGLPIGIFHVLKGKNFEGTSRGMILCY